MALAIGLQGACPIIKNIWTSTFVLFSAGFSLVLLGALTLAQRNGRADALCCSLSCGLLIGAAGSSSSESESPAPPAHPACKASRPKLLPFVADQLRAALRGPTLLDRR